MDWSYVYNVKTCIYLYGAPQNGEYPLMRTHIAHISKEKFETLLQVLILFVSQIFTF